MEKEKTFKLMNTWAKQENWLLFPVGTEGPTRAFVSWLYENGFTIETRFQGEDLEKQEELFK